MIQVRDIEIEELKSRALRVREYVLKMAVRGGCYIGSAYSCTDILVFLYTSLLKINRKNLKDPGRDYLFLSKGHAVPALYGTLVEVGLLEPERLENHLSVKDLIYWHPDTTIPGVEFHSGSLGHLLAVATGVAMDCRMKRQGNRVFVIVGDGELNEGTMWESLLIASAYKLDNLIIIVDRNHFQANGRTERIIPIEPLLSKFISFGLAVRVTDGHDFQDLANTFSVIPFEPNKPAMVIAHTVRGKGLPSIEARPDRLFCSFSDKESESIKKKLKGTKHEHDDKRF